NFFSPIELNDWNQLPSKDKVYAFFKSWACKEAFLKAHGKGWLEDKNVPQLIESVRYQKETLKNSSNIDLSYPYCFELIPGYASALFVVGPVLQNKYYAWS